MTKIKFKNRDDEICFFRNIKMIEAILDVKIRYVECIYDLDQTGKNKEDD